ncbi:hypothetical protein SAMN05880574_11366 [Chryseobacterium sp. RU37D]|uniref:hypothetical protein n=1 Tax=Chryseobacterium sp. RU37D TaxID=1907397 RepID=UPI0009562968|nr:hypothetical protein [Chryseobacterium sp. RU37D]SIQ45902.1 hypothetical protein SAMN05880574_11366 [Chryseobacterium sp. RU37D]
MKKSLSAVIILAATTFGYAQVGINTSTPASTLDITAKNSTGTTKNVDGLLVPRVDRERAQSMVSIPVSTLIYVNSVSKGTQSGNAVNIDTVGYYYFDGSVWVKLNTSSGSASSVNIYNSDGTLTGNRTVTQANKTLAFTGTSVNAFSVDGKTLSVDAANHRLGVGTNAPTTDLDLISPVSGSAVKVALRIAGTNATPTIGQGVLIGFNPNTVGGGYAHWGIGAEFFDGTTLGNADFIFKSSYGGNYINRMIIKNLSGFVGIGTTSPTSLLHLKSVDPLTMEGVRQGDVSTEKILAINPTGVVKSLGSIDDLGIPRPAVFRLDATIPDFLTTQGIGGKQVIPMSVVKNGIEGLTYDSSTSTITFPAGTYQMTLVYESTHNATGCNVSSYFEDFPVPGSFQRVHSTAPHNENGLSNHGGSILYVTTVPAGQKWSIHLGRGQSGNCTGPGMNLIGKSTQLLVYKIGS